MIVVNRVKGKKILGLLLLMQWAVFVIAQPLNITSNLSQGCSPLIVQFSSTMPGLPAGSYSWNLGNGNVSETAQPVATYVNPGNYTISLTVSQNGNVYTDNHSITVFASPTANFSAQGGITAGCVPLNITFLNAATQGSGAISSWLWNYGDGVSQSFTNPSNPSHNFTNPGSFTITLQVTDVNGCSDSKSITSYIHASGGPVQVWYPSPNVFCTTPATTTITNNMTGQNSYSWTTSDGQSSSSNSPMFTFSVPNQPVTISCTATDNMGCTSTSSSTVNIGNVVAHFDLPDVVCKGYSFSTDNQSIIGNQYNWSFGSSTSSMPEPTITFNTPGWNPVTLTSTLNGVCPDTYVDSIYVEYAQANFQLGFPYICELPHNQMYINSSYTNSLNGPLSYNWDIQFQGQTSQQSPLITYTNATYLFEDYFHIFYDTLIVTSPNGCKDTATSVTDIYLPHVWIVAAPLGGCQPFTPIVLNDSYFTVCPYDNIVGYLWDFDDGFTSTAFNPPSHTYQDTGMYDLSLQITTAMGCQITQSILMQVGDTSNIPSFTIAPPVVFCGSDTIQIINNSVVNTTTVEWNWDMSASFETSAFEPEVLPLDTGWQDVTLLMSNHMCIEELTIDSLFYVKGPITKFGILLNCDSSYYVEFPMSIALDYDDFLWDFDDGFYDSTNAPVTNHTYTSSFDAITSIYSINYTTGCEYWDTVPFKVRDSRAEITANSFEVCIGDTIFFSSQNSLDEYKIPFMGMEKPFMWIFGDSTMFYYSTAGGLDSSYYFLTADSIVPYVYDTPGEYTVQQIIVDENACWDTAEVVVTVLGPVPEFSMWAADNCTPVVASFFNATTHNIPIVQWEWDFGLTDTSMAFEPPTQEFTIAGIYTVSLTATDSLGCKGTTTMEVVSSEPVPIFIPSDTAFCVGDTISFENNSLVISANPQYSWALGSFDTIQGFEPNYVLHDQGIYEIQLIVDDGGCVRTSIPGMAEINVQTAVFEIDTVISGNCFPVFINFSFSPLVNYYTMMWWDFGNGGISSLQSPEYVYSVPGSYNVSLHMTTSGGCVGVSNTTVLVGGATADFDVSDHTLCLGDSSMVTLASSINLGDYIIDFGDGYSASSDSVWHSYTNPGLNDSLALYITYYDQNGLCPVTDSAMLFLVDVRPDFSLGINNIDSVGCAPHQVQFLNQSVNGNNYSWNFGDGSGSQLEEPAHLFAEPGSYSVSLSVSNLFYGCEDVSTNKTLIVNPVPDLSFGLTQAICSGDSLLIQVNPDDSFQYAWSPAASILDSTSQNPLVFPDSSTTFVLTATNVYNCKLDTSLYVFVQNEPDLGLHDTVIIVGSTVIYDFTGLEQMTFTWTPDTAMSGSDYAQFFPLYPGHYEVEVNGYAGDKLCFTFTDSMFIDVIWEFTVDIPNLFTPNEDSQNDVLFVRGWGIYELLDFSVYNRWGERIFQTNDITQGWDGTFKGEKQAVETYFWSVKVRTYSNQIIEKSGSTTLIR